MERIDVMDKVRVIHKPKNSQAVLDRVYTVRGVHCRVFEDKHLIGLLLDGVPKMIDARCCQVEEKGNVAETNTIK